MMQRFQPAPPPGFGGQEERLKIGWLINLRWFASGGLFLLITFVRLLTPVPLQVVPLYGGNLALALSNVAYWHSARRGRARQLVELQVACDLLLLAWLVSFSGGFENPFISFACFHMIIASIFLRPGQAYGAAVLATILLAIRPLGETFGLFPHYHLAGLLPDDGGRPAPLAVLGELAALAATLTFTVYLTTTIMREVNRHRASLVLANTRLEEQDREKSRYVWVVSHDIRASVSAIQGCLRVVLDGFTGGEITGKSRDMVARAEARSVSLLRFLEELAYLSALRSQTEGPRRSVSLTEAIERALGSARESIDVRRLDVAVESAGELRLEAHAEWLERLVECLLDNAVAYTPEGGRIRLRARDLGGSDGVELVVQDTGIGIPGDEVPRVFEDFYRGANARRVAQGAGLGLAIVQELVKRYDGRIAIEAGSPCGTTVTVTLPREPAAR